MNDIEIIAEIGVNHNGDFNTAVELVHAAVAAGVTTAKFQLWDTESVYPRERWDEMKALELSSRQMVELHDICRQAGIRFLCTPDNIDDAVFLKHIGVDRLKIGSSNVTNQPLLKNIATLGLPVILSTGACEFAEMSQAVHLLKNVPLAIMHCLSAYPAPLAQMNLLVIRDLQKRYRRPIGFSDHTLDETAALIALGLGARTFEKHLTLDRTQPGPDHKASMDAMQMKWYVSALRDGATALGSGVKQLMPCEVENRKEYDRFVAQQAARAC